MAIVKNSNEKKEASLAAPASQASSWTVDDIKKSDILVFRENSTEYIETVVAPNGFQVGLLDEAFLTDLLVTGHITGSGVIYAELGFSGSLTKLVDGDDYLVAGNGITLLTQSNGSILISSDGSGDRLKEVYQANVLAGYPLQTMPFADLGYSFEKIDVYVNGELLLSGTQTEVSQGDAEYSLQPDINGVGQIIFNSSLSGFDNVTVTVNRGGVAGGSGFQLVQLIDSQGSLIEEIETADYNGVFGLKAGNNIELVRDGQNIIINGPNTNSSGQGGGGGIQTSYVGGSGINVDVTGLAEKTVSIDYEATNNIITEAPNGSNVIIEDNDTILLRDVSDNIVKEVSMNQLSSYMPGNGIIGNAEDGTYTDGLFTDFVPATLIGTAVDRFNEVLKALAPPPAPSLKSLNYSATSQVYSGNLSFDQTHPDAQGLFFPVLEYSQYSQAGFPAIAVNELYEAENLQYPTANIDGTTLNFFRVGVLHGSTTLLGELNFDVSSQIAATGIVQFTEDSYGNAEIGELQLEVNGSIVHTIDLSTTTGTGTPPAGSASSLNVDGSGFSDISTLRPAYTEGGTEFPSFQSRSTSIIVNSANMQQGYNRAKVIHSRPSSSNETNYVEWVWSDLNSQIVFSNSSLAVANQAGSVYISGVRYHTSMDLSLISDISNAYEIIYSNNPIVTTSSVGVSSNVMMPIIGNNEDMSKEIAFSNTISVSAANSPLLNEQVSATISVPHPIKGDVTSNSLSSNSILLYDPSSNANETLEDFTLEGYRLQDDPYNSQLVGQVNGFYEPSKSWDPTVSLTSVDQQHNTGLQIYNGKLLAPGKSIDTARIGDFRSIADGGVLQTYAGNPDYSDNLGAVTGTRSYIRWIKNNTGVAQRDIIINYNGDGTLISSSNNLSGGNLKVSVKMPTNTTGDGTGWMDANSPFTMFNYGDADGGYVLPQNGSFDSSVSNGAVNYFTFGKNEILANEVIIVKIEANHDWTGNLNNLEIEWGASASGNTAPSALLITAQPLEQLSIAETGISAKLSFGPNNPVTGFTNVVDPTTSLTTDYNESYTVSGYQRGVFANALITGILNDTLDDRFDNGDLGELKLELNGNIINACTIDLTNLTSSGPFVDSNNTGFYNLIAATPSIYASNGVPSYNNIYRSGEVKIQSISQTPGHNYYRVLHTIGGIDYETNYVEWVNDDSSNIFSITDEVMQDWVDSNISYQSGIGYFSNPESSTSCKILGLYSMVYSLDPSAIGYSSLSNVDISNILIQGVGINTKNDPADVTSLPELINGGEDEDVFLTGSLGWNGPNRVLPGPHGINSNTVASLRPQAIHPIKNSNSTLFGSTISKSGFLIAQFINTSTVDDNETFDTEDYRLPDQAYTIVTDITSATWSSTVSLVGNNSLYSSGLMQYNGKLISPYRGANNGDFLTYPDGGTLQGPSGNPDYSSVGTQITERVYIRSFYNSTTSDYASIDIDISGIGQLSSEQQISNTAGPIGNNSIFKLFVKLVEPTSNANSTTGWLDCGEQATGSNANLAGCSKLPLNQLEVNISTTTSIPIQLPTGRYLYGTGSPQNRNYLLIKVVAHKEWTGNLNHLGVRF